VRVYQIVAFYQIQYRVLCIPGVVPIAFSGSRFVSVKRALGQDLLGEPSAWVKPVQAVVQSPIRLGTVTSAPGDNTVVIVITDDDVLAFLSSNRAELGRRYSAQCIPNYFSASPFSGMLL
jgi:hypothetical protein